jgi:DNA repair ATPase RecN
MRKKAMRNVSIMTELSTEKVELALTDDLKRGVNILKAQLSIDADIRKATVDLISKLVSKIPQAKERVESNQRSIQATDSKIQTAESYLKAAASAAKELGVNVNDIPLYSEVTENLDKVKKSQRDMEQFTEQLKRIVK